MNKIIASSIITAALLITAPVFAGDDATEIKYSGNKIEYMGGKYDTLRISFGNNATFEEIKTSKIDVFKVINSGSSKYFMIESKDKKRVIAVQAIIQILADDDSETIHLMLN